MIEPILPGLYRLEIPIPHSPLKTTNAYVIKGKDRNLLVDTGLNRKESLKTLQSLLEQLSIDMLKTDIILTHLHSDHSGLVPAIKTVNSKVYASAADAEVLNRLWTIESPWNRLFEAACSNGFSKEEALIAAEWHPGNIINALHAPMEFMLVNETTVLSVGEYLFTCIETPGHTKGHICLYEPSKRILISGDHIMGDISPNITDYWDVGNPLKDFLVSLKKILKLPIDLVLPGHRRIFTECSSRIGELLEHHSKRLDEVYNIVADSPMTGYQVAARMKWSMVYRSWGDVAIPQKYFATGEALAHLHYLECQGLVKRRQIAGQNCYWR